MQRKDLEALGLDSEVITKVLDAHHKELTDVKEQLETEKTRATTLEKDLNAQKSEVEKLSQSTGTLEEKTAEIEKLKETMAEADLGIGTRGLTKRTDLYELNATNMPACIFETGSIKADLKLLRDSYDECGRAIAKGVCAYFGITFKSTSSAKSFKVRTKGKLIARKSSSLLSKKTAYLKPKTIYTIVTTSKNGKRGKLKSGAGWITITPKYAMKIKA